MTDSHSNIGEYSFYIPLEGKFTKKQKKHEGSLVHTNNHIKYTVTHGAIIACRLPTMNRSDLIAQLAELHPQLQIKDAELGVKVIIDALSDTLSKGGRVEVRGFGSFALVYRPQRTGRNPKTGNQVKVLAKYIPQFKAGKELRERVNNNQQP